MMCTWRPAISAGARKTALLALALCAFPLSFAWGMQIFEHLIPCPLCLVERWPYYFGTALAALALALPGRAARAVLWLVTACLLVSVGLAAVHAGVEFHWWKSPLAACNAPNLTGLSLAERLAAMPAVPQRPCEDPDYPLPFLPISFVQLGLLYAISAATMLLFVQLRDARRRFE